MMPSHQMKCRFASRLAASGTTAWIAMALLAASSAEAQRRFKTEPWNAAEIYRPYWPSGARWPDYVELSCRPQLIDGDFLSVLNVYPSSPEDANAFGVTWKHRAVRVNHVVVRYLCVRGRRLEPTAAGHRLEWRDGKRWQPIKADLHIDYRPSTSYARRRSLGYSEWHYTFAPVETYAIRCAVKGVAQPLGSPAGLAVAEFSAGFDPAVEPVRPTGKTTVVGREAAVPFDPELTSPAHGADVQVGQGATVRWPHAMIFDTLEVQLDAAMARSPDRATTEFGSSAEARALSRPEWWDGTGWRALADARQEAVGASMKFVFPPRAALGLRVQMPGVMVKSVSVRCGPEASAYFDKVYQAGDDLLSRRLVAEAGEPELETFRSYLLPIPGYKAAIGRKDHAVEAFVAGNGTVILVEGSQDVEWANGWLAGTNWALAGRERLMDRWFALACGPDEHELGSDRRATQRGLLANGLPGVWLTYRHDGCRFREEAFTTATSEAAHAVVLAIEVANDERAAKDTALCLVMGRSLSDSAWLGAGNEYRLPGTAYANCRLDWRLDPDGRTVRQSDGSIVVQSDRLGQWCGTEWERVLRIPLHLGPGESQRVRLVVPQVTETIRDAVRLARIDAWAARQSFVAEWEAILDRGMQVSTPEPALNEAWRNWIGQLLTMFWDDGKFKYGGYWYEMSYAIEDGWPAEALAYAGQNDTAAKALAALCGPVTLDKSSYHHQWINGLAPTHALTGYRLLRERAYLDAILPQAIATAEWTIAATRDDRGKSPRGRGLLPRHTYGGDIHTQACALYANACCWRGLLSVARLCRHAGRSEQARRYETEAGRYHDRLAEVWKEVADKTVDPVFYPMAIEIGQPGEPGYQEVEQTYRHVGDRGSSQSHRPLGGYWHILLNFVMESGFFPWRSPETTHMLRYSEERGGLKAGLLAWYEGKAVDPHYTFGYYRTCVDRGETEKVLAALYGFLAHNAGSEVGTFAETSNIVPDRTDNAANLDLFMRRRWDWGETTVRHASEPLTSAAGVAIQLLRMVLLYEETDDLADPNGSLSILPHAPRRWFAEGRRISVSHAPTFYGKVDFEVRSRVADGRIEATVSGDWRETPKVVRIRLRHPEGKPLRSVSVNGEGGARHEGEWVYLPAGLAKVRVVGQY